MSKQIRIPTVDDVKKAQEILVRHLSPAPLIRSYALESELGLKNDRRVWIKDYGWTPVGSFKLLGALNWTANQISTIGNRPIAAHSSGNFASGLSFAGMRFDRRVLIVMPEQAPKIKFDLTRLFGAEIYTYDVTTDHTTGQRDKLTLKLAEQEHAIQASPYDDPYVIAGNGVGGLEIVEELKQRGRTLSHFICPVSGGGLMAGHALAINDAFPSAHIIGVEPTKAADFHQSLKIGKRVSIQHPQSICDGLCSYDVGEHNWPILSKLVAQCVLVSDEDTCKSMRWLYERHGLRTEPSGAIATAAAQSEPSLLDEESGDITIVISGRNVDEIRFQQWINA